MHENVLLLVGKEYSHYFPRVSKIEYQADDKF